MPSFDRLPLLLVAALMALGPGCRQPAASSSGQPQPSPSRWFEDVTEAAGLSFTHVHGGSGRRYMVETMGSGGGFIDIDADGWLDVFLLQGAALPGYTEAAPLASRLFRNRRDGTFEDVTARSGLGETGYAMGTCFGDIDNDALVDVYVTAFGPDRLFRNRGDGRFEEITREAGISNPRWGAGCAFADYDRDGFLDLFVVNYVEATVANHRRCGTSQLPMYCHPDVYAGVPDLLYRNRGDGTFEEVGAAAGVRIDDPNEAKGLGVLWLDYDDDGWLDAYVANDSTRNFLFRNQGDGTFREVGASAGVAYDDLGRTQAGMGVSAGDVFGTGRMDLVVTNLDFEANTVYRNLGGGLFEDATTSSGLAGTSATQVGFGVSFVDADNDGDLDLVVANGHIIDNIADINPSLAYAQRDQLFANDGAGTFIEVAAAEAGPWFETASVSRGLAAGDFDNDGSRDLLVTVSHGPARLLRNVAGAGGRWIAVRLLSRFGGRDAVGARVRLFAGDLERVAEVRAGSSYLAQEDGRLHFGLGQRTRIDRLEIRWPEGDRQVVAGTDVPLDRVLVIRQRGTPADQSASEDSQ